MEWITCGIYILSLAALVEGCRILRKNTGMGLRMSRYALEREAKSMLGRIYASEFLSRRRGQRVDKEIYEAISFLRNIIMAGGGRASSDFVIEQLSQREGMLGPTYLRMLGMLRMNRKTEAAELFSRESGTLMGSELAGLLLQWDDIDPEELTEILLSHQKNIKEVWITLQKRRDETVSDLIYLPVVVNVFLIFINFIYVGYFIKQQELLQMLF